MSREGGGEGMGWSSPSLKAGGATPDIVLVANVEGGYTGNGELTAHSDHHWTPTPSAGSLLYALEVPERGGDTSFYNMHLAYEALDEATKRRIADLRLITYNPFLVAEGGERPKYRFEDKPLISPVFPHPLVRTHPDSGKKILYLDAATEARVLDGLVEFARGRTLLVATHSEAVAARMNRVFRIAGGRLLPAVRPPQATASERGAA